MTEVIGQTANSGEVVQGPAKIIQDPTSVGHIEEGSIVIVSTVSPETAHHFKNAAAIVTDEGGVMTHAAKFSREYNIPCIVGTKNATKTFKEGERIEVNTKEGNIKSVE